MGRRSGRPGPWDLVVVGGGTAGMVGARTAAGLGARVALVEAGRTGGDCLYTGCVPSKALIAAAGRAASARRAPLFGAGVSGLDVDFQKVMRHVRGAITAIEPVDSPAALEALGVSVIRGGAVLSTDGTVEVDGTGLQARNVLLAPGAAPDIPDLPGIGQSGYGGLTVLTSETIWDLGELPGHLAIIGGGPVGCELGQAFVRLGSEVTIIGSAPRLLPREDPDAGELLRAALASEGVRVLTGTRAESVSPGSGGGTVRTSTGLDMPFTHLLAATGRTPRTSGLGLAAAGIAVDGRGHVITDRYLRTTNPRVWAAGDVTAHPCYTHTAGVHAALAAMNAVLGIRRPVSPVRPPRVTFTDPEIAAVGEPTGPDTPGTRTVRHSHLDRAITDSAAPTDSAVSGFTRIRLDGRGRITGGTVVGPRAGETIGELSLAVHLHLKAAAVAGSVHPYPTYSDALWAAVIKENLARWRAPLPAALIRLLVAARRRLPRTPR